MHRRKVKSLDIAATFGNQALRSLLGRPHVIPFPHASRVREALGTSAQFIGVHHPEACAARGTAAFTAGTITYFADRHPNLHVATHEATHQLQHAGLTNDAGLGAEGQASIAADAAWTGRSAAWLIGRRGKQVPPAQRNYVFYGQLGRLGELGEMLTFGKEAYAIPSLITQANSILVARRSGITLSAGSGSRTVDAPDGSGKKTLAQLSVGGLVPDPAGDKFFSDCREAANEVMGGKGLDPAEAAVIKPGGEQTVVAPPADPGDYVAMVFFVEEQIRKNPAYSKMSDEEKREFMKKVRSDYDWLSKEEKAELRKRAVASSKAKELGIDQFAEPRVGEAFAVFPAQKGVGPYRFHFATVIMVSGPDRVTFENEGGKPGEKSEKWQIMMYGPAEKGQTFHDDHRAYGPDRHTLVIRNLPSPPPYAPDIPTKSTAELITLYGKGTGDDRYYLKQELDKRIVTGTVQVIEQEDWTGDDEVFLRFSVGSSSAETGAVRIPKGASRTLTISAGRLVPADDPITVTAYEYRSPGPVRLDRNVSLASTLQARINVCHRGRCALCCHADAVRSTPARFRELRVL